MHWAAGLYTAAVWILVASIWTAVRRGREPYSGSQTAVRIGTDLLPGLLLGLLVARLL